MDDIQRWDRFESGNGRFALEGDGVVLEGDEGNR